jgi:histidyl-tRNA synthetase
MTAGSAALMDNAERIEQLRGQLPMPAAQDALNDIASLLELTSDTAAGSRLRLTPALARGLSYYTGPIFEVISDEFSGSLGGGGRYDNLVGMFSGKQVPAIGFSLGLERILMLMEEAAMFPPLQMGAKVMICPLTDTPLASVVGLAHRLRQAGVMVEIYPEQARLGRQLQAADSMHIPYALIVGPDEVSNQKYPLKELSSGEQQLLDEAGLITALS